MLEQGRQLQELMRLHRIGEENPQKKNGYSPMHPHVASAKVDPGLPMEVTDITCDAPKTLSPGLERALRYAHGLPEGVRDPDFRRGLRGPAGASLDSYLARDKLLAPGLNEEAPAFAEAFCDPAGASLDSYLARDKLLTPGLNEESLGESRGFL
jgi:hypothetical protein